ncbi:MAG: nucleotide sugar dehydrogenase [Ardenticatenaceae bacterium]|nr:nucleotide sugar dehydrogenase [Anaerolineales bacterium]MCB8937662.1 nucleotide sugar dehydrogenase [Ardenticatenaceae bacterium]MCB8974231.1 nucleotide sugar dehydrogenase [Ardenticatenaceae bacterium]
MERKEQLLHKIDNRQAKIGVVGLGYVGLPLAVAFAQAGFTVIGVDVSPEKVALLQAGQSYIDDVPAAELAPLLANGRFHPTTDYNQLADTDAISICVPTPLRKTKDPDISYIINAAENISRVGATGKLVVLESTTYPGTTEEVILPRLIHNGDRVGRDFFLAFSPERIDPGRTDYTVYNTPKVIGGMTDACAETAVALYGTIVAQPVPVSSTAAAEMVKLLENTFRAVNIGLVNEVALMCDRLGLNVWEVVEAAATKPYGFMPFYPGPGLGGHCIPIDPHYLSWKLRTLNYTARFIELAAEVNSSMPAYAVSKIAAGLNEMRKAVNGSRVLLLGVAYKPNVADVRESPALDIIHLLQAQGAEIAYHDPHVPSLSLDDFTAESVPLTAVSLQNADCVVIVTNHAAFDYDLITQHAPLIVDTRNALKNGAVNGRLLTL